jgi:predicted RND superfamily exporter protein
MGSLVALRTLERASGVGGEIDLMVSGPSVARPATIEWMSAYERAMLRRFGYGTTKGCGKARLCPAFSLPDLFAAGQGGQSSLGGQSSQGGQSGSRGGGQSGQSAGQGGSSKLTAAQVSGLLRAIPPYFSQAVISPDRRVATLAFGVRLMALQEQERVVEQMRAGLHPPAGVSARLVGLSVLAADAATQVASPWRRVLSLLVALAAVALVLLVAFKGDLKRVLTPFVPVVLATGWSALLLFATRVPLNPMSVTLSALVIAVSTEFSVLLSERFRQEALTGCGTAEALSRAYRRTGAAVAVSGATAIAGFAVIAFSDIAMLRDFGLVTLLDLSVSLVGVLVALPATVALLAGRERLWARRATRATSPSLG